MALTPGQEGDLRCFVHAHWLDLVRTAYLIRGDRDVAEDIVRRTLATAHPHWDRWVRHGTPTASVRGAVLGRAVSTGRRRRMRESLVGSAGGDAPVDDDDPVLRALAGLPPRMRAVVVLRVVDDLTEVATAETLGMSVRSVRRMTSRGLPRLRAALPASPPDGPALSLHPQEEVRRALRAAADRVSPPPDPYALVMATVLALRRRRRAVIAWSGAAALAVGAVVALSTGVDDAASRDARPVPERTPDRRAETLLFRGAVSNWPVRGALGTDAVFAAEFERAVGSDHRLVYAEDGEAGRLAVAVSADGSTVVFQGLPGTAVEGLERWAGRPASGLDVVVAVPIGEGHLVVALMPPHLRDAQISLPSVARDGSVHRLWRQVPVEEGVGRVVTGDPIGAVRVRTPAGDGPPQVVAGPAAPPGALACGRCDRTWVAEEGLSEFAAAVAAVIGAPHGDVRSRLALDAFVPAAGGRVVRYVATLPTGGLLRATYLVTDPAGGTPEISLVEPLRSLPGDDADRPVVFTVQPSGDLLIVAPGAGRLTFTPLGDAPALPEVSLTDGIGVLLEPPSDPGAYRISAFSAQGSSTRSWHGSVLLVDDPLRVQYRLGTRGAG